ncbi:hypothetical protein NW381_004601 [Salmonella enterica]|nr:hypothetical protein [Salmonella enterica]EJS3017599.1 hypothetical protein [Salmonella enterica]
MPRLILLFLLILAPAVQATLTGRGGYPAGRYQQEQKKGLWQALSPVPLWQWRKQRRPDV